MAKNWYVVHVYSGHEAKAEILIRQTMDAGGFGGAVSDVKVPVEEVPVYKNGKKKVISRKFLPGYILVEIDFPEREWKDVSNAVRRIPGVMGFVGHRNDVRPNPLSRDEVKGILQKIGEIKVEKGSYAYRDFHEGEEVRITSGPFESFTGKVEEVFPEKGRMKVSVGIFGRTTPVELTFHQVEKNN